MSTSFHFEDYEDHDFYHARFGRGAVVVAVKKNPENGIEVDRINSDFHVAGYFCSREQSLDAGPQQLDPIQSIKEKEGLVEIEIAFNRRGGNKSGFLPMSAVVRRVLPQSQVTLEVIDKNESPDPAHADGRRLLRHR